MPAQYWTITGYDMWRMEKKEEKREVFEFKNLNTGEKLKCSSVTEVKDAKLLPVKMPEPGPAEPKVTQKKKTTEEKPTKKKTQKKSKYKGVRLEGRKFSGTYWDGSQRKLIYLGMFDYELLAAAAVLEAKGDKEGAKRLRNEHEEGDRGQQAKNTGEFRCEQ